MPPAPTRSPPPLDSASAGATRSFAAKRRAWPTSERSTGCAGTQYEPGAQVARGAGIPEVVCEWILGVAEHYDGTGPAGLSGSEIPVFSRIVRAAKRCDEFIEQGFQPADLRGLAGTELDPAMVDALASMLERAE